MELRAAVEIEYARSQSSICEWNLGARDGRSNSDLAFPSYETAMIKSMTPEAMASMSEQLGLKLTPEQAVEAQKAMANLSPDQLNKLMRWAERAQQTITEQAKRVKNWIMGRPGLLIAFLILILAIILHYFGYIGR